MTSNRIPDIPLKQMERISPSRFIALQGCQLREIWQSQREVPSLLPGNTAAKIGIIIHRMLELTYKGVIRTDHDIVEKWEEEVRIIEQTMRTNLLDAHLLPLSQSRNYEVKKLRCLLLVQRLLKGTHNTSSSSITMNHSEVWLETIDKKIGGKVDLIRQTTTGAQLIDFKTGSIVDEFSNTVKSEYQTQIKLYAALYHEVTGLWPDRLTLVGLDRAETDVEYSSSEAEYLLDAAKDLMESINKNILSNGQEFFASPKPVTCYYCNFRPACHKYWSQRTFDNAWPTDIHGEVTNIKTSPVGLLMVEIYQDGNILKVRGLEPVKFNFLNDSVREVCLCNLKIDPIPGFYIPTKSTVGYIVSY
jgi:RecB family exonuclease